MCFSSVALFVEKNFSTQDLRPQIRLSVLLDFIDFFLDSEDLKGTIWKSLFFLSVCLNNSGQHFLWLLHTHYKWFKYLEL